jgi:hypothetical protein
MKLLLILLRYFCNIIYILCLSFLDLIFGKNFYFNYERGLKAYDLMLKNKKSFRKLRKLDFYNTILEGVEVYKS